MSNLRAHCKSGGVFAAITRHRHRHAFAIAVGCLVAIVIAAGCRSSSYVFLPKEEITLASPDSVAVFNAKKIVEADLLDNRVIQYDAAGAKYHDRIGGHDSLIAGKDRDGSMIVLPFREVGCVVVEESAFDENKTTLLVAVAALLLTCVVVIFGAHWDVGGYY